MSIINGMRGSQSLGRLLRDRVSPANGWLLPANLALLVSESRGTLPPVPETLSKYSLSPLAFPFLDDNSRGVAAQIVNGERVPGASLRSGFGRVLATAGYRLAWCLECANEDIGKLGHTYWHRTHLVPGVKICPRHRCGLAGPCGKCRYSSPHSRYARLPATRCWCNEPLTMIEEHRSSYERTMDEMVARFAADLLANPLPLQVGPRMLGQAYLKVAQQLDVPIGNKSELSNWLDRNLDIDSVVERGGLEGRSTTWHLSALKGNRCATTFFQNVCLVQALFKGVSGLRQSLIAETVEERLPHAVPVEVFTHEVVDVAKRDKMRQKACEFLQKFPSAGRRQFHAKHGSFARWLRRYDHQWLSEKMPQRPAGATIEAKACRQIERDTRFDESLCAHIHARHKILSEEKSRPQRITATRLVAGHRRAKDWSLLKMRMPLTRDALPALVEGDASFGRRLHVWAEANPSMLGGKTALRYVSSILKMSQVQLRLLLNLS
ncbi:TniQ protein [Paraburkholderia susongensis]|uniref:TniQ protein n=2 Tax=Paraburkholderia susongensis TaxID=1515439 RepID=A0A1X7KF57_9BURK|nr:TniQ protein [Paraburkholderia susongensis]